MNQLSFHSYRKIKLRANFESMHPAYMLMSKTVMALYN